MIGVGVGEGTAAEIRGNYRGGEVPVTGGGGEGVRVQGRVPIAPLYRYFRNLLALVTVDAGLGVRFLWAGNSCLISSVRFISYGCEHHARILIGILGGPPGEPSNNLHALVDHQGT